MDKCYLCKSKERDEIKYGEFLTRGKISVHYFCLLLTSNLLQKGHDNEGFLGFLIPDIKDEASRVASAVCCYCKKKSANISCCASRCHKTFHLTCGVENEAENQFIGTFKSYCSRHVSGKKVRRPAATEICCICYETIISEYGRFSVVNLLRAPCCKNGWFHKWCLASFAKTAGYFFKCPLCNDNKVFRQRLSQKGIFIPDRDAAWELEPNAYAELLERPTECSAVVCEAKGGRTAIANHNKLIYCGTCGSVAIHRKCMTEPTSNFHCDECASVVAAVNNASIVNISASQQNNDEEEDQDEDEDVDVCEEDDDSPLLSNNSQSQDSDEDEGTVQPLGRMKSNNLRIFDEELTDGDSESSIVVRQKMHKKSSQLSSDDEGSIESAVVQRKHSDSPDAESLFDSGAETDRSASSGAKLNLNNSFDVSVSYSPVKPKNELSESRGNEFNTMESLRISTSYSSERHGNNVKQVEMLEQNATETRRTGRRFTSLNDSPSGNTCIAKRTRRQSMCAEITLSFLRAEEDAKKPTPEFDMPNNVNIEPEICSDEMSREMKTDLGDSCSKYEAHNEFEYIAKKTHSRARTNSEDPSSTSPALERIRRRSFLQSPYSTPAQQQRNSLCESSEILNSATNKRSRSDSMPDKEISQNKRLKNTSTLVESENNFVGAGSVCNRRSSRGRSPLSSNICSVYAYITPAYVKKRGLLKQDMPSVTDVALPTETATPEVGELFNTNKSNIIKPKIEDAAVNGLKTKTKTTSPTIIKYNRSPQETFFNSYSILTDSPVKSKPQKPRNKRVFKEFSNQELPSNQTKIESFFKRL